VAEAGERFDVVLERHRHASLVGLVARNLRKVVGVVEVEVEAGRLLVRVDIVPLERVAVFRFSNLNARRKNIAHIGRLDVDPLLAGPAVEEANRGQLAANCAESGRQFSYCDET
jgi:hypothetical protein